jgi:prepilin-type N-terminal cleavage/methylation domain-containing protein
MTQRRRGFTLVEIMVAMALTLFILAILSEVFVTGADTFRTLKAVGDLNASLRSTTNMLRSDLSAKHFEGTRRLSDASFWTEGPPQQGYFYLYQGPPPGTAGSDPNNVNEGFDADLILSRRCVAHKLAFTVRLQGTRQQDFFTISDPNGILASVPNGAARYQTPNTFSSQWMEVCYFLSPVQSAATADGTQLYALYRQQRVVVGDNSQLNWGANRVAWTPALLGQYQPVLSCTPNPNNTGNNNTFLYFNSPADLTIPERRTAAAFVNAAGVYQVPATFTPLKKNGLISGDDLVLTDVISFDVKVWKSNNAAAADFGDLPTPFYYDTWSHRHDDMYDYSARIAGGNFLHPVPMAPSAAFTAVPAYRITALQITLRIWDPRTKLSRQISIVQEM